MPCSQGKVEYPTDHSARAAISAIKAKGASPDLHVYQHEEHFHITKVVPHPRRTKNTRPTVKAKAPALLSGAKLRRKLENAGREIAACNRRLAAADAELAAEQKKAEQRRQAVEAQHAATVAYIEREVNRIMEGRQ